jgi:hypothetical protein
MRNTLLFFSATFVLMLAMPAEARTRQQLYCRALFIGDSITMGIGADEPGWTGFVGRLQRWLPHMDLVNAGCRGGLLQAWTAGYSMEQTRNLCWWGSAWDMMAQPYFPVRFTHVLVGGAQLPISLPPDLWELELQKLVDLISGKVIISTRPKDPAHLNDAVTVKYAGYRAAVHRVVAANSRVQFGVDFHPLLEPVEHFDNGDVHPNQAGHDVMAQALLARLAELGVTRHCNGRRR